VLRVFMATHRRFHTPHVSILFSAAVIVSLTLFSTFISALTISTIIRLIVYASTCAALPALRRMAHVPRALFMVRGGPAVALLACALSLWLLTNSTAYELRLVAVAATIGLLMYWAPAIKMTRGSNPSWKG